MERASLPFSLAIEVTSLEESFTCATSSRYIICPDGVVIGTDEISLRFENLPILLTETSLPEEVILPPGILLFSEAMAETICAMLMLYPNILFVSTST